MQGRFNIFAACVAMACLIGCTGSTQKSADVQRASIAIRLTTDWDTLFPPQIHNIAADEIASALYDRLTAIGPGLKVIPYLARSWTERPGSITFTLRTDATCADGTPVTASVVADSFQRLLSSTKPLIVSNSTRYFGPGPYTVTATDSSHVTFTFASRITGTAVDFSENQMGIVCPAGWATGATPETRSYGSGPYVLTSAVHGVDATLSLRPEWRWGPNGTTSRTMPKNLDFKVITNDTTAANLVETGGLDLASISGPDIDRLLNDKDLRHGASGATVAESVLYNESAGRVTTDPIVRQALSTAIDRAAYNKASSNGHNTLSSSVVSPYVPCFDPSTAKLLPTPSVSKAKSLLLSDGYTAGSNGMLTKNGKPLAITLLGVTDQAQGPEYVAAQWTAVGIQVTQNAQPTATAIAASTAGNFDAFIFRYTNGLPNLFTAYPYWTGTFAPAGNNYGRIANADATRAGAAAASAATPAEACKDWSTWQRALLLNYDTLPLASIQVQWFSRGMKFAPYYYIQPWSMS